jgi:hypothetical protein
MSTLPALTRVLLKNFRSIASCDVQLRNLTFLVGLNGTGKSNFIDALRLCRDALRNPLEQAFASRAANLQTITHWNPNGRPGFGLRLDLSLPLSGPAHYAFWIAPQTPHGFEVTDEECVIGDPSPQALSGLPSGKPSEFGHYRVRHGIVTEVSSSKPTPISFDSGIGTDRLYLPIASGASPFREVYDFLINMEFYSPDPQAMKVDLDTSGPADVLDPNGSNLASVFDRISSEHPDEAVRIIDYMRHIVPGLHAIKPETFKTYKLLTFEQEVSDSLTRSCLASTMSDGTLRALAVLVSLFQRSGAQARPSLVAIEEPETGLHPAAVGILLDAMRERQDFGQVIVSSHSADLLDNLNISNEGILALDKSAGATEIAPLDNVGLSSLHDHLYTAGELLRMDQLKPQHAIHHQPPAELFTEK